MKIVVMMLLVLLPVAFIASQDIDKPWIKSEMEKYQRQQSLSKINYPGDPKYDVKYYKLDITVNHIANTISGIITCNAEIVELNVTAIYYDLTNSLVVDSVIINGSSTTFSRGANTLNLSLNNLLNQGDKFSTLVYYHGTPGSTGFGSFTFGSTPTGQPAIYTLSEPYGAKDWWPCKDTPADKADSADIWITVTTDLTPVSNGRLMEIINNGNGTHTYKWKSSYPIAQYLISMAITNYVQYSNYFHYSPVDSMPVNHFIYPEFFNSNTKSDLDKTVDMIEVFSKKFGEYPFIKEKYGHAQFGWSGGMEHQTITSINVNNAGRFTEGLVSHELAHQWYGDAVTCKDWHHIWLNEGFATYAEGVWIEAKSDKPAYDSYIALEMANAKNAIGSIWVQDISTVGQIFNGARSYSKGGVVLHMLRGIVGDSTFYDIMRTYTYHPTVAYGVATTEDFQTIAEAVSGLDLNYFFQQWIYGVNFPRYSVVWSTQNTSGNLYDLALKITQNVNSNPIFFTMPIQVKVNFASGDTLITVFNNAQVQNFNIAVNGMPTSISFDPNNWILKNLNSIEIDVEDEITPNTFTLEQNYPNPFNPTTKIRYTISTTPLNPSPLQEAGNGEMFVTLKVYDILGNEVAILVNKEQLPGVYDVDFDAANFTSGVYLYQLQMNNFIETKKMILLR
jgi:aminopeptidase N